MAKNLKNTFGLDITDSAITAVELGLEKRGPKVINYSRVELEPGVVEENSIILNPEAFKEALLKLLKEGEKGPIKSKKVIISIPEEKTFSHHLSIPIEQANHEKLILENAKDFVPIELSEAAVDFRRLESESTQKEIKFDFVAVQKSIVESLISILEEVGLKVVAVDVMKNSLVRTCKNPFISPLKDHLEKQKANKAFIIINIDHKRTTLIIQNSSAISHAISLNLGGNALKESFEPLVQKIQEFYQMVKNQESIAIEINTIYILGPYLQLPGLSDALKKVFPDTNITHQLEYIQIGEETEQFYVNSIGLALRALLPRAHKQEINLLPKAKKEELFTLKLTPVLRNSLLMSCLVLGLVMIYTGITKSKSYFDYVASRQEVDITLEKIKNPYLNQTAKETQQKVQFENQINSLLEDALPASWLIQKLDSYNLSGISLVNVAYQLDQDGKMNIHIRAKTTSRSETEKFILKLEKDPVFSTVISPLSNLVDRGERFIQIDLILDKEKIFEANQDNAEQNEELTSETDKVPKTGPRLPSKSEDEGETNNPS